MNVFIDTNIFLSFFHYSKDDLNTIEEIFASHEQGTVTLHLTQQVHDELRRNRERKIKDALKRFSEVMHAPQMPNFMKLYSEYDEIIKHWAVLKQLSKNIMEKAESDIKNRSLKADDVIDRIFSGSRILKTIEDIYASARMRVAIGNPPGKDKSIGDAINWITLLKNITNRQDLYVISQDGDYYSSISDADVHPFLEEEWRKTIGSSLYVHRDLSSFVQKHLHRMPLQFDKDKQCMIKELERSASFSTTHKIVAELDKYNYFSLTEVRAILDACKANTQVSWIIEDEDIANFLRRITAPVAGDLTSEDDKEIMRRISLD